MNLVFSSSKIRETVQWLRTQTALSEDSGTISRAQMVGNLFAIPYTRDRTSSCVSSSLYYANINAKIKK